MPREWKSYVIGRHAVCETVNFRLSQKSVIFLIRSNGMGQAELKDL